MRLWCSNSQCLCHAKRKDAGWLFTRSSVEKCKLCKCSMMGDDHVRGVRSAKGVQTAL